MVLWYLVNSYSSLLQQFQRRPGGVPAWPGFYFFRDSFGIKAKFCIIVLWFYEENVCTIEQFRLIQELYTYVLAHTKKMIEQLLS